MWYRKSKGLMVACICIREGREIVAYLVKKHDLFILFKNLTKFVTMKAKLAYLIKNRVIACCLPC